jgi:hypothetical protein
MSVKDHIEELTEDEIELATEKRELVEETIEEFTTSKTIEKIEEDVDDILPEAESERIEEVEQTENESVISAIEDANAEESEDESLKERHDIPML